LLRDSLSLLELTSRCFQVKCQKCGGFPEARNNDFALCLICGRIMCNLKCKKFLLIKEKRNVVDHAENQHNGCSIFIFLQSSQVVFIDKDLSVIEGNLFINEIGSAFT